MHQIEYDYRRGDFKSVILSIPLALKSHQELAFGTDHYIELYLKSWQLYADLQSAHHGTQETMTKMVMEDLTLFQEHWTWIESHCAVSVKFKIQSALVLINCFHQYPLAKEKCCTTLQALTMEPLQGDSVSDVKSLVELLALYIYPACHEFDESKNVLLRFASYYSKEQVDIWLARIHEKQQRSLQHNLLKPKDSSHATGLGDRNKLRQLLLYYWRFVKESPLRSLALFLLTALAAMYFLVKRLRNK